MTYNGRDRIKIRLDFPNGEQVDATGAAQYANFVVTHDSGPYYKWQDTLAMPSHTFAQEQGLIISVYSIDKTSNIGYGSYNQPYDPLYREFVETATLPAPGPKIKDMPDEDIAFEIVEESDDNRIFNIITEMLQMSDSKDLNDAIKQFIEGVK